MEKKTRRACVVQEDLIAEAVYDPILKTASFIKYENGLPQHIDSVLTEEGEIFPLDPKSDILSRSVVLLPSIYGEYESDAALLEDVQAFIHKRLDVSPSFERIAAQYVFLTWLHDRLNELPYLRARGDYGSGKTRFLQVIGSICYRPIFTAGASTTSPIFRMLDQIRGTLILDEADLRFSNAKSDLVKILNTGYQKGIPLLRSEGRGDKGFEVKAYDVFGPKIVATRENFDDEALESRFLTEDMGQAKIRADIPIQLDDSFRDEALQIRNKLLMWRFRNFRKHLVYGEKQIDGLHPRLQQIIGPLLAVMPDTKIQETLLDHAHRYNAELIANRALSWESEIIIAILALKNETGRKELTINEIRKQINSTRDSDEMVSAKKVGWLMRAKLQLKGERKFAGFTLSLTQNAKRIEYWSERLGITNEDVHLNIENVVADVEQQANES